MRTLPAKLLTLVTGTLAPLGTFARSEAPGWLVDGMYGSGKINTVLIVVAVVLLGIAAWMFTVDRRLSRLEKNK